ncbi:MAG: DUF3098 domain-containing protein [Flavobacteriales bacterium]
MANNKEREYNEFPLSKKNYILLSIGVLILLVGYLLMIGGGDSNPNTFEYNEVFSFRRITLSPIILGFGFVFIIYAILKN